MLRNFLPTPQPQTHYTKKKPNRKQKLFSYTFSKISCINYWQSAPLCQRQKTINEFLINETLAIVAFTTTTFHFTSDENCILLPRAARCGRWWWRWNCAVPLLLLLLIYTKLPQKTIVRQCAWIEEQGTATTTTATTQKQRSCKLVGHQNEWMKFSFPIIGNKTKIVCVTPPRKKRVGVCVCWGTKKKSRGHTQRETKKPFYRSLLLSVNQILKCLCPGCTSQVRNAHSLTHTITIKLWHLVTYEFNDEVNKVRCESHHVCIVYAWTLNQLDDSWNQKAPIREDNNKAQVRIYVFQPWWWWWLLCSTFANIFACSCILKLIFQFQFNKRGLIYLIDSRKILFLFNINIYFSCSL